MSKTADVVIVGAGIVGAACARELTRAGLRVTVIESRIPGGGATAAGMGHIVVMDDSEAQFQLTRLSQQLWAEALPELPAGVEPLACGTLWVAADEEEMAEVERKRAFYSARQVPVEVLDAHQLAGAEPNLRPGLAGALRVPEDSVVYPPVATRAFLQGSAVVQAEVQCLAEGAAVLSDGSRMEGDIVVNATGAWASKLTPEAPVRPRKGHLLITDRYPGWVRHQLVELGYLKSAHGSKADSVAFNVQPRATGQALIGSSRQFGATDPKIEPHMLQWMLRRAVEYMPSIARLSGIRAWTGFRAATPDSLPLIGPYQNSKRIYLATGHEGLGITTCLGTAHVLAAQLLGRASKIPVTPYLPSREHAPHA
ncbi:MAG TPA: D-amino-acid oxidase [Solibacterales bacterium]|nr:D-amino-acid oxidase [Bryobacterales bacterium]